MLFVLISRLLEFFLPSEAFVTAPLLETGCLRKASGQDAGDELSAHLVNHFLQLFLLLDARFPQDEDHVFQVEAFHKQRGLTHGIQVYERLM